MSRQLARVVADAASSIPSLAAALQRPTPCHACCLRQYARMPGRPQSGGFDVPKLRPGASAAPIARPSQAPPPSEDPEVERAEQMRQAAKSATASMFPWERRQMDGGKLTTFDRVYWIAFAGAIGFLVIVNGRRYFFPKKEVKIDQSKADRKAELALEFARGSRTILECEDVFEGMGPQDVLDYVDSVRQTEKDKRSSAMDEYDGMSPEEINAAAAANATM